MDRLLRWKWRSYNISSGKKLGDGLRIKTTYGVGSLQDEQHITHDDGFKVVVETIKLDYGVLHQPRQIVATEVKQLSVDDYAKLDAKVNNPDTPNWMKLLTCT